MARWRKRKNKKSGNARKQEGNEKAGATRDTIRESWREQETRVSRERCTRRAIKESENISAPDTR